MIGLRRNVRLTQVLQRRESVVERPFTRAEALRDNVRQVVIDHILLGVHKLLEALHAKHLGRGRRNEQNVGLGGRCVCPLDIKGNLNRPEIVCLLASPVVGRRRGGGRIPLYVQDLEGRVTRLAGIVGLATQVLQVEGAVEVVQVAGDRRAAEGVDQSDGRATTVNATGMQSRVIIGACHRRGIEAAPTRGVTLRLGRRRHRAADESRVEPAWFAWVRCVCVGLASAIGQPGAGHRDDSQDAQEDERRAAPCETFHACDPLSEVDTLE